MKAGYPSIQRACKSHRSWTLRGPNAIRVAAMMEALGWEVEYRELGGEFNFEIRGDENEPEQVALDYYRKAIDALRIFDQAVEDCSEYEQSVEDIVA